MFSACSHRSAIGKQLSGSDSLVVNFNTPGTNLIEKTLNSTEKKAIRELIGFVDGKAGQVHVCGYDGNLLFYKNGILTGDVSFNYSEDSCRHFMLMLNGQLTPVVMSNKAADFLKSLASGNNSY